MNDLVSAVVLVSNDEYWLPYALEASRGFFNRYVIYDIGSTDKTLDIINWFVESQKGKSSFYVENFPMLDPKIQGKFRNSMIAEALSEYYFILDGDEVYTPDSYKAILSAAESMNITKQHLYGVVRRIEIDGDSAYGLDSNIPHHRLYHQKAIWTGKHPGEIPFFKQEPSVEYKIPNAVCFHFHNCTRSSKDAEVPKRIERRSRGTYRPGEKKKFDVIKALPILSGPIQNFARSPSIEW